MELRLQTRREGSATIVGVGGEIDNFSAPAVRDALAAAFLAGATTVVADLTDTDFLDSSALGALVGASKHHDDAGQALIVVCPKPALRKLFEISHLDEVIEVRESIADALTG